MKRIDSHIDACPVCGAEGRFSFQSRDLMYDTPEEYRYLVCSRCHSEYQSPLPSASQIASFYPDDYDQYAVPKDQKHQSGARTAVLKYQYGYAHLPTPPALYRLFSRILAIVKYREELPFVRNGRALDIGCGNGRFIRSMNSLGWQCEGVEFNETAVKVCRQAGLRVFHGELKNAGYDNATFDLVTARHLIEHLPELTAFVEEVARILKPGGRFVLETPNNRSFGKKLFGKRWFANEVPRHLVLFNLPSLTMLVKRHGFKLVYCQTSASPKILLNSWDYLTGNRGRPSRKVKFKRLLAKPVSLMASLFKKGDIIFAVFEKETDSGV